MKGKGKRSQKRISGADLERLAELALTDLDDLFERLPETGRLYGDRLFAIALCQGAALHYVDGKNGINDFDVWSFFSAAPRRPFPYRRIARRDFGSDKFGQSTKSPAEFVGKRVDLIGRSLEVGPDPDPVQTLVEYLRSGRTDSARMLAEKAVVMLCPDSLRGTVVWPSS
jgi:hypothetical protein